MVVLRDLGLQVFVHILFPGSLSTRETRSEFGFFENRALKANRHDFFSRFLLIA
jgi:hypothetical protein